MPASEPIGILPRQLAWEVLLAVGAGAYADVALERALQRTAIEGADRALATDLAYGAIRQRRLLDAWLDLVGKVSAAKQPPKLRWLLHIGLYQLLFCCRIPPAAAVSTSVSLAQRGGLGRLAAVVNGLLRALLRQRPDLEGDQPLEPWRGLALPEDPARSLALRHSLPDWLARDLLGWLPAERAEAFGAACNNPPALDLRVNRLRASREQVLEALQAAGVAAAPIEGLPWGLVITGRSGDLRQLPGYDEGHWCVQDRSAQRIVPLLDPQQGERVLDACAAPGGKSTHLAEAMGDQGLVLALDRGELVDEQALVAALQSGHLAGAGLDVFATEPLPEDSPLWGMDNVIVTPHNSGSSTTSNRRSEEIFLDNLERWVAGTPLNNLVG